MTRREVIRVAIIALAAIAAAAVIGVAHWGPWPQLAVVVIGAVLASAGAPGAFGWREPR